MTDDLTHDHLRALLADATARAEKAESERDAAQTSAAEGLIEVLMARERSALAACAEMRAALLDALASYEESGCVPMGPILDLARALRSRPDLGAGKVLVERAVLDGCAHCGPRQNACRGCDGKADLDALLKQGGG